MTGCPEVGRGTAEMGLGASAWVASENLSCKARGDFQPRWG
jgi:hypothetical protein